MLTDILASEDPERRRLCSQFSRMGCCRYIELNPVRAEMVEHPGDYRWSSYCANVQGETSTLIRSHALYLDLGRNMAERRAAYRELFRHELEPGLVDKIRKATNSNYSSWQRAFSGRS